MRVRESGIEILRVLAMLMIVTLHVLGAGGILDTVEPLSLNYAVCWFLEIASYGAVNCFGLISGYVYTGRDENGFSYKRIIKFAAQVYIITLGIYILTKVIGWHNFGVWDILVNSLPLHTYLWYIKSYLGMLIFVPVLNAFLKSMNEKISYEFMIISFVAFTILPLFVSGDVFGLNDGYSTLWLCILYIWGGIFAKNFRIKKFKTRSWAWIFALGTTGVWIIKLALEHKKFVETGTYVASSFLISYTSPVIVVMSVSLLGIACNLRVNLPPRAFRLTSSVFGIYVVHMHYIINGKFITGKYAQYADGDVMSLLMNIVWSILKIYLVSWVISYIFIAFTGQLRKLHLSLKPKNSSV